MVTFLILLFFGANACVAFYIAWARSKGEYRDDAPVSRSTTCPNCNGLGVKVIRGNHFSIFRERKCYTCMGSGEILKT